MPYLLCLQVLWRCLEDTIRKRIVEALVPWTWGRDKVCLSFDIREFDWGVLFAFKSHCGFRCWLRRLKWFGEC